MLKKAETSLIIDDKINKSGDSLDNQDSVARPKKPYVAPKLTHEGKWDTVTMQFGGSF